MKISAINEGVSLIANIGVIGSIVFLGLEMQQNTAMMQSQTRNSIVENQLSFYERGIENPELADIRLRLGNGEIPESSALSLGVDENYYPLVPVEETERFQYTFFLLSELRMWENEFYQYQIGLFDSAEFEARTNAWRGQMSWAANIVIWRRTENAFAEDFRVYLNELIDEIS